MTAEEKEESVKRNVEMVHAGRDGGCGGGDADVSCGGGRGGGQRVGWVGMLGLRTAHTSVFNEVRVVAQLRHAQPVQDPGGRHRSVHPAPALRDVGVGDHEAVEDVEQEVEAAAKDLQIEGT